MGVCMDRCRFFNLNSALTIPSILFLIARARIFFGEFSTKGFVNSVIEKVLYYPNFKEIKFLTLNMADRL